MPSANSKSLVKAVMTDLTSAGLNVLLSGGWAEELQGLVPPRPHKDIDLVCLDSGFSGVDQFIQNRGYPEIQAKHFSHKRAFMVDDVMVEIILIQSGPAGYYSTYWDRITMRWPADLQAKTSPDGVSCLSPAALRFYHESYETIRHFAP